MKHLQSYTSLAASTLIITALVLAGCSWGNRPMSAEAFLKDFNSDRDAAYEKYKDKDILLTGKTALDTSEYSDGRVILTLEGGAGVADLILCENKGTHPQTKDALLKVKKGERVEVRGRLSIPSIQPTVSLEECQVQP